MNPSTHFPISSIKAIPVPPPPAEERRIQLHHSRRVVTSCLSTEKIVDPTIVTDSQVAFFTTDLDEARSLKYTVEKLSRIEGWLLYFGAEKLDDVLACMEKQHYFPARRETYELLPGADISLYGEVQRVIIIDTPWRGLALQNFFKRRPDIVRADSCKLGSRDWVLAFKVIPKKR